MKGSSELYQLVYDYYATRIMFGYYAYGEALPSIPKICKRFHLAVSTVRAALAHLEQDGYIKLEAFKVAKVSYQTTPAQIRAYAAHYFLPREFGLRDISLSGHYLLEPLWDAGLQRWGEKDWGRLRDALAKPISDSLFMPMELYIIVFSSLDNKLLLNLYWEIIRYIGFPYLSAACKPKRLSPDKLDTQTNTEIANFLKQKFTARFASSTQELFDFLQQIHAEYAAKPPAQIPFIWHIYRSRPQMRYSLVSDIIRKILKGQYPVGSYLPSLPQMAEQYGVALSTVRRTITLLCNLGVVRSYHGKGTQVCISPENIDVSKPDVRCVLRIYRESLQLLAWTARSVTLFTLQSAHEKDLETLAEEFRQRRLDKQSYLYFETLLSFISTQCPSAMIRECYKNLKELLACGYPITLLRIKTENLDQEYVPALLQAEINLKTRNLIGFSDAWSHFLIHEGQHTGAFIEELAGPLSF